MAVRLAVFWEPTVCLAMCWVEMPWCTGQRLCFGVEDTRNELLCVVVCFMRQINRVWWQRVAVRNGHDSDKMTEKTVTWNWHPSESWRIRRSQAREDQKQWVLLLAVGLEEFMQVQKLWRENLPLRMPSAGIHKGQEASLGHLRTSDEVTGGSPWQMCC